MAQTACGNTKGGVIMREVLYRGKRTENGEWVDGSVFVDENKDKHEILVGYVNYRVGWEIDPKTAGQFVGIIDKNGKKIFEGDVIKFHKFRYEPDWVGVVGYDYCSYIATGRMPLAYEKGIGEEPIYSPFEVALSSIDKTTIEIIGNIHDNPELLEVSNNDV